MKAIKQKDGYYLYKIDGHLELWRGKYGSEYGFNAGYVAYAENFEYAVDVAKEEAAALMADFKMYG
jgi:hypothetical protein